MLNTEAYKNIQIMKERSQELNKLKIMDMSYMFYKTYFIHGFLYRKHKNKYLSNFIYY